MNESKTALDDQQKRTGGHRRLSLLIAFMILFGILFGLLRQKALIADRLSSLVTNQYLKELGYEFSFVELQGNPFTEIILIEPSLRYRGEGEDYQVFRADKLVLDYDFRDIFKFQLDAGQVVLENSVIELHFDSEDKLVLPGLVGEDRKPSPPSNRPFRLDLREIVIEDLDLRMVRRDGTEFARILELQASLDVEPGKIRLGLHNLVGSLPDRGISAFKCTGNFTLAGEIARFEEVTLQLPVSKIALNGVASSEADEVDLSFETEPIDLGEIQAALRKDLGLSGELYAGGTIKGPIGSLLVEFGVSGLFEGHRFDDLLGEVRIEEGTLFFEELEGTVNGARVEAWARIRPDEDEIVLEGEVADFDLSAGFVGGGAPSSDWDGWAHVEKKKDIITFEASIERGEFEGFPHESLEGSGVFDGSTLKLSDVRVASRGLEGTLAGEIGTDGGIELFYSADCGDPAVLIEYFDLPPELGGRFQASGKVEGVIPDSVRITSRGPFTRARFDAALMEYGQMEMTIDVVGDRANTRVVLGGRDLTLWNATFSDPELVLRANDRQLVFERARFARVDTVFQAKGRADLGESGMRISLSDVLMAYGEEEWRNDGNVVLHKDEERWWVERLRMSSERGRVSLSGRWDGSIRTVNATLEVENLDLGVPSTFIPAAPHFVGPRMRREWRSPLELYGSRGSLQGRWSGSIRMSGPMRSAHVDVEAEFRELAVDTLRLGDVVVKGRYDDGRWQLEEFDLRNDWGHMGVEGTLFAPVSFDPQRPRRPDSTGTFFDQAAIDLTVRFDSLQVGRYVGLLRDDFFFHGSANGTLEVTGSLARPQVQIDGDLGQGMYGGHDLPHLTMTGSLRRDALDFDRLSLEQGGTRAEISGRFPFGLSLPVGFRLDRDGEMDLEVAVPPESRLDFLGEFQDLFAEVGGKVFLDFTLRGTPARPLFDGFGGISGGAFRLAGMEERFWDVALDAKLSRDSLLVRSVQGREGKDGTFEGFGHVIWEGLWPGDYFFSFPRIEDFFLGSIPDVYAQGYGRIEVRSSKLASGDRVPLITGYAFCKEAVLSMEFTREGTNTEIGGTVTPTWLCDLTIDAPQNIWIKNREANVEIGGRDLRMIKDREGLRMRGSMRLLKGSYTVYNNKFKLTEGEIDFTRATGIIPNIRVEGEIPNPNNSDETFYLTYVWVEDQVNSEPQLSFTSDAGYSEADIWRMLGGGVLAEGQADWDPSGAAFDLTLNYLERMLESQLGGFTIDFEQKRVVTTEDPSNPEKRTTVALGRYLAEGLYVRYRQGLAFNTDREFQLEYRVWDRFLVSTEIISYVDNVIRERSRQTNEEINLDFKFRWEW